MRKKLKLRKDLPSCPAGRIFRENVSGDFFHSMTDKEIIETDLKMYTFTAEEVNKNPEWFEEIYE